TDYTVVYPSHHRVHHSLIWKGYITCTSPHWTLMEYLIANLESHLINQYSTVLPVRMNYRKLSHLPMNLYNVQSLPRHWLVLLHCPLGLPHNKVHLVNAAHRPFSEGYQKKSFLLF